MAKVFTITPGLQNMGAMKTGGQGSVYKGRREGNVITAIKLLPTPIFSESEDDKNHRDFKNEVEKLKKVNIIPNPNVVKILSSGLSETGNFPFIEMEYIEGPDLEELLQPPHDPVFSISEVVKVAEHLSNALAHCHRQDVKHGDIKSNNVKYNNLTGNYVLLDFGLAVMSDEQRRTSLRKAGAVEFMAPEQNEGDTLFQTDVYSFGVIIFELLAGRVPFPLTDKGETARNYVRLAHMETLPPDVNAIRRELMPATWSNERKHMEMQVPDWLIKTIYTCLKKKPENRFKNGVELHDFIIKNSTGINKQQYAAPVYPVTSNDRDKDQLQQELSQYKQQLTSMQRELEELKTANRATFQQEAYTQTYNTPPASSGVSKTSFIIILLLALGLAAFAAYSFLKNSNNNNLQQQSTTTSGSTTDSAFNNADPAELDFEQQRQEQKRLEAIAKQRRIDSIAEVEKAKAAITDPEPIPNTDGNNGTTEPPTGDTKTPATGVQYMVVSKAYFYNSPDTSTRRNAFVVPGNNAIVNAQDEQDDFVYVVFTNTSGQTSKGWLREKDLQQVDE